MINIERQISHWLAGSAEDFDVASSLVDQGKIRHGLFFAHLSLEKSLKALFCQNQQELAPPIHNLLRLADKAGLALNPHQRELLAEVNSFNIEGRYPELHLPVPTQVTAEEYIEKIREMLECLSKMS